MKITLKKEFMFHPKRKWRFDFAIPEIKVAIELEGGNAGNIVICNHCHRKVGRRLKNGKYTLVRSGGRHNSITGYRNDCEKYNAAASLGWTVFRYTTDMITKNPAQVIDDIKQYLNQREQNENGKENSEKNKVA